MMSIAHPSVAHVFEAYPSAVRRRMLALRELIFDTAAVTEGVGPLDETLKWGEPAYLTTSSGSGSTIRIGWKPRQPDEYAMYFNCKTALVETFSTLFPRDFRFEGRRALVLRMDQPPPKDALVFCIRAALTYHRPGAVRIPTTRPGRALEHRIGQP